MKKIAFICVHNSCRSQMAEAIEKEKLKDLDVEIYSAGSEEYPEIKPLVYDALKSRKIAIKNQYPKLISDIPNEVDYLITMGCNVTCPSIPAKVREDWGLDDPSGLGLEAFENTCDLIIEKVDNLRKEIILKQ